MIQFTPDKTNACSRIDQILNRWLLTVLEPLSVKNVKGVQLLFLFLFSILMNEVLKHGRNFLRSCTLSPGKVDFILSAEERASKRHAKHA